MHSVSIKTELNKFNNNLWGYHVPLTSEVESILTTIPHKRVICTIENVHVLRSAIMYCKEYPFILINKETVSKNNWSIGNPLTLKIEPDHSEYGMEMPDELSEMLLQEELANKYFQELTKGKQRSLIYIVSKVKSSDSRLRKALAIIDHLKTSNGKLDFKMLNDQIKYYNNL